MLIEANPTATPGTMPVQTEQVEEEWTGKGEGEGYEEVQSPLCWLNVER